MPSSAPRSNDISTVVSILPYPLWEKKPGLVPGEFRIPAAKPGEFVLFNVERCQHAVYLDDTRPRLIVPDPSDLVARSIVFDHKTAMICYEAGIAEPGLAWVWGEFTNDKEGKKSFILAHQAVLEQVNELQMNWYHRLLLMADDDWARYKQHKMITNLQRTAAQVLGQDREWLLEQKIAEALSKCKFCFSMVHPEACICPTCHGIVDEARYRKEYLNQGMIEKVPAKA